MRNETELTRNRRNGSAIAIRLRVAARNAAIRDALARIRQGLAPLGLDPEELGTVEVVFAEVMNNVAEHAYAWRRDGEMVVSIDQTSTGLRCIVTDHGRPMPEGALPFGNPADPSAPMDMTAEGGYGWLLIRELARDVEYVRRSGVNQLTFRIAVAKECNGRGSRGHESAKLTGG